LAGTGLGLSIVQGLARANGGDTWYEPNTPHGSCFAVRLPRVRVA
jgi:signal transduction histidine kinase